MTSFFDFIGRMVEGKPVFADKEDSQEAPVPSAAPQPTIVNEPTIRKHDDLNFPVVYIKRVTTHFNGNDSEIYAHVVNTWHGEILLYAIRVVNTDRRLNASLRPGEEHEFLIYKGPKLQHEYHEAWLDYKTQEEKDYFRAVHDVTFTYHSEDKTYTIDEMRLHHPIRDIYE